MSLLFPARFDPSKSLLAYAVQALDIHQVKVQPLVDTASQPPSSFSLAKGVKLSALEWISAENIALGLVGGSVLIFSPASNSVVGELAPVAAAQVTDIHFSHITNTTWVADINGSLHEWDVASRTHLRLVPFLELLDSTERVAKVASVVYNGSPHLLVGTHNVYLLDVLQNAIVRTFPAHVQPLTALFPVPTDADLFVSAAENDRFANVYSISKAAPRAVLVSTSAISLLAFAATGAVSMAAAVTESGLVEVFNDVLRFEAPVETKKRRKQLGAAVVSKHASATVKLSRPPTEISNPDDALLPVVGMAASEAVLHLSWLELGPVARFDALTWHTEGKYALNGDVAVHKSKQVLKAAAHTHKSHDVAAARLYNENHTVVTEGSAFQNELGDDDEGETLAERLEKLTGDSKSKAGRTSKKLNRHTAGLLTVVLSQALRNNDHALLETVLSSRDLEIVQSTIARLDASLAVILLDRLAERMTRQQQRFDQMNYWLKWIIIIHGGVLSLMPNLKNQLANLHAILVKKASTMPRLMELQGRVNLIEQLSATKKEIFAVAGAADAYDDADTDVEYVEEIDDAVEAGLIDSDSDIELDEEVEEEEEGSDIDELMEDGLSDVEAEGPSGDRYED